MKASTYRIGAIALAIDLALGCACEPAHDEPPPGPPPSDGGAGPWSPGDAGQDAEAGLPIPDAAAPPGTHKWAFPPDDCAIYVPDDLSAVEPLPWEPCPFQPDGCSQAGAPWAQANNWGYAATVVAAQIGGDLFYTVGRMAPDLWWEGLLFKNDVLIGSWHFKPTPDGGRCIASGPLLYGGQAHMLLIRAQAESSPWLFWSSPEDMFTNPGTPEVFGPPDAAIFPAGRAFRTPKIILLREYGGGFMVRDLLTGATERPKPSTLQYVQLTGATPVEGRSFYGVWTGTLNSVWVHTFGYPSQPLLIDDMHSYDRFETDGNDFVWIRSTGHLGGQQFETVELWTAPVAFNAATLQPKKLLTLPVGGPPNLSVGEGWAAARLDENDMRLYRLSDGLEKRLPTVDGISWVGGQWQGLAIAGGQVFVMAYPTGAAGNDARFVMRFEIDKLPTF